MTNTSPLLPPESASCDVGAAPQLDPETCTVFACNPAPMWVYDTTTFQFLAVNDAAMRHYGYSREEFLRMTILDMRPADENPRLQHRLMELAPHFEKPGVWLHRRRDGTIVHVLVTSNVVSFRGRPARLVLTHDVSEQLRAEARVRELNATLEARVAERTARLAATLKELETFSYSVSHDLRAPLRAIDGFARMLQERHGAQLDADGQRLVAIIREETSRTTQLIDDLLLFSRAARQELDTGEINMTDLAESAFQNIAESNPGLRARLELSHLPPANGDRAMIRQVFANLLGNAVKFSARAAAPLIRISGERDGARSIYRIQDNGVGFNPRYAAKLFAVFQRLHSQADFEGTGVGLALVQRIIHRHGGEVWAEGAVDAGATFSFSLPCAAAATAQA